MSREPIVKSMVRAETEILPSLMSADGPGSSDGISSTRSFFDVVDAALALGLKSGASTNFTLPRKSAFSIAPSPGFVSTTSVCDRAVRVEWPASLGGRGACLAIIHLAAEGRCLQADVGSARSRPAPRTVICFAGALFSAGMSTCTFCWPRGA